MILTPQSTMAASTGEFLPNACSDLFASVGVSRLLSLCIFDLRLIKDVVEGPPRKLVEAVAEDIASQILEKHILISGVRLHISKPHVAVEGVVDSLGGLPAALDHILFLSSIVNSMCSRVSRSVSP